MLISQLIVNKLTSIVYKAEALLFQNVLLKLVQLTIKNIETTHVGGILTSLISV